MNTNPFFRSLTVISNGPIDSKPVLSGLYLRFLEHDNHLPVSETLHAAAKELGNMRIVEIKGTSGVAEVIELPHERETFCLVYQFMGNSVITASGSWHLKSGQHVGCRSSINDKLICRIDRGKTWMVLIDVSGGALQSVHSEFELLSHAPHSPFTLGYRQKQLFDRIQQLKAGRYTLDIKLNYYIALLIEQYQHDLNAQLKAVSSADIALYHKAAAYIQQHYRERKLTRQKIADALCVSVRTLTRAFEGKQVTIGRAIQLARLHKAREWFRSGDDPIEQVASELHFSDTQQFIDCYTELFMVSPDADRRRRR